MVVGIDANAVLGQQDDHDSSRIIGKGGLHSRNERGVSFAAWLHLVHLAACNTMFDKPHSKKWTHQMWSTGAQRQIDYILISSGLRAALKNAGANEDLDFKSDHRFVHADFESQDAKAESKNKPRRRRKTRELTLHTFHEALDNILAETIADAEVLAEKVVAAAKLCCKEEDVVGAGAHSQALQNLLVTRGPAEDPKHCKGLTRMIWALLRKERKERNSLKLDRFLENWSKGDLQRILRAPAKKKQITAILDSNGVSQAGQDEILEASAGFYANLYAAASTDLPIPEDGVPSSQ